MGRPTKLTEEVQQKIVGAILLGMYQEQAALMAGITGTTFYRWMEKGLSDLPEHDTHREFRATVEKARAEAEAKKLQAIHFAVDDGTWQAAAWWLERSFPDRWGRRQRLEVDATQKIEVIHVDASAERVNMVLEVLSDIDALTDAPTVSE